MNINEKNEAEEKLTALDLIKEFFGIDELYDTFRRVIGKNKKDKKCSGILQQEWELL